MILSLGLALTALAAKRDVPDMFEQKISDVEFFMHSYVVLAACFKACLSSLENLYRIIFDSYSLTKIIITNVP